MHHKTPHSFSPNNKKKSKLNLKASVPPWSPLLTNIESKPNSIDAHKIAPPNPNLLSPHHQNISIRGKITKDPARKDDNRKLQAHRPGIEHISKAMEQS